MAVVKHLEQQPLAIDSRHTETQCTYSIVHGPEGISLQIDTYGSSGRQFLGKKSQSIRFAPEAIRELKNILSQHFPS